ncbi:MAG: MlaD family protein [Desulfobacteraceae bacterium]|nr:MlaD family protein [Desulfobacteraceae bacterium]
MTVTSGQTTFRYANQLVGLVVLLTVLIFTVAFLFSGRVRQWMDPGGRLKVILPSDGLFGLAEGAVVEVLGTKAGQVRRIVIDPQQQMYADVQIQSNMKGFVRADSTAVIRKRFGVAGDSFLEISRGLKEPLDWEFAVITATADRTHIESLGEILGEVRSKIFPIIGDTQVVIRTLLDVVKDMQNPQGDLNQLLANFNAISGKVSRGEGLVGRLLYEEKLVDDVAQIVVQLNKNMQRLDPLFDDLEATIGNVSQISAQINEQTGDLPELTRSLKEVLDSVQVVMKDLSRTTPQLPRIAENLGQATDSVPVLLLQTQQVMAELEQLIEQLQSHWLLGGSAGKTHSTSTRISPAEVNP